MQQGWDLGLVQSAIPETYGGAGDTRSVVTGALIAEELAWGDLSIALHLLAPRLVVYPGARNGHRRSRRSASSRPTPAPQFRAGSAAVMEPRFDFDLSGADSDGDAARTAPTSSTAPSATCRSATTPSTCWCTRAPTTAKATRRSAASSSRRARPGVTVVEREKNMGIKALATYELALENCRVPAANRLGGDAGCDFAKLMNYSRVGLAAMAVGVARAAFEYARDYAKERKAFGVAIGQKQAIAFMLAEMAMEIDATRLLAWEAAWKLDRGEDATREAYLAKNYAANMVLKVTDNAVQVLGGHGYIREHPVEMWLRNGRGFAIIRRPGDGLNERDDITTEDAMIDFELSPEIVNTRNMIHMMAEQAMRPISREYDEREHEKPWDFLNMMWSASQTSNPVTFGDGKKKDKEGPSFRNLQSAVTIEELSWGDAGLYLSIPNPGLGGAAVAAAGTPEQKQRFLARFREGEPKWGAMAITEPGCGSDSAAITTTAARDGDHWVINGTKIFVTSGLMAAEKSDGFVVVWATVDKSAGRGGIKAFVVEHGTPGHDRHQGRAQDGHSRLRHGGDRLRGLPHPGQQPPRQRRGEEDHRGLQGRDGDLRRHASRRRRQRHRHRPRRRRLRARGARQGRHQDPLRHLAEEADDARARLHGHGSQPAGRAAADLARLVDDGSGHAQQPRGLDVQGQGRAGGDPGHAEGRRAARPARLLAQAACSRSGCATPRSTTSSRARSRST